MMLKIAILLLTGLNTLVVRTKEFHSAFMLLQALLAIAWGGSSSPWLNLDQDATIGGSTMGVKPSNWNGNTNQWKEKWRECGCKWKLIFSVQSTNCNSHEVKFLCTGASTDCQKTTIGLAYEGEKINTYAAFCNRMKCIGQTSSPSYAYCPQ